jgi:hypothetical protein
MTWRKEWVYKDRQAAGLEVVNTFSGGKCEVLAAEEMFPVWSGNAPRTLEADPSRTAWMDQHAFLEGCAERV